MIIDSSVRLCADIPFPRAQTICHKRRKHIYMSPEMFVDNTDSNICYIGIGSQIKWRFDTEACLWITT